MYKDFNIQNHLTDLSTDYLEYYQKFGNLQFLRGFLEQEDFLGKFFLAFSKNFYFKGVRIKKGIEKSFYIKDIIYQEDIGYLALSVSEASFVETLMGNNSFDCEALIDIFYLHVIESINVYFSFLFGSNIKLVSTLSHLDNLNDSRFCFELDLEVAGRGLSLYLSLPSKLEAKFSEYEIKTLKSREIPEAKAHIYFYSQLIKTKDLIYSLEMDKINNLEKNDFIGLCEARDKELRIPLKMIYDSKKIYFFTTGQGDKPNQEEDGLTELSIRLDVPVDLEYLSHFSNSEILAYAIDVDSFKTFIINVGGEDVGQCRLLEDENASLYYQVVSLY